MMKPAKPRLALSTETLRSLSTAQLATVQGGGFAKSGAISCVATLCVSCGLQNA